MKKKRKLSIALLLISLLVSTGVVVAQKKTHTFQMERIIPASADTVWKVVGEEFADVSNYHAGIVSSELINGSTKSEVGCERVCNLDNNGKKYVKEKLSVYDPENRTLRAQISSSVGVPTVPEFTYAEYKIEAIDSNSSKLIITQVYRTKPAFLGFFAKGKFKKSTKEHLVFIEHYILTGEAITKENQKEIKKKYKS